MSAMNAEFFDAIEQIEKEKDWQFTGEQTAELIRMAIYPDLRS